LAFLVAFTRDSLRSLIGLPQPLQPTEENV